MTFAEWIKARRDDLGLSQARMAQFLDVDPRNYVRWEHGDTEPGTSALIRLAKKLADYPLDLTDLVDSGSKRAFLPAYTPAAFEGLISPPPLEAALARSA